MFGCTNQTFRWMLISVNQKVMLGGKQGSPLSPALFKWATNPLLIKYKRIDTGVTLRVGEESSERPTDLRGTRTKENQNARVNRVN